MSSTTRVGSLFGEFIKRSQVWQKGLVIPGLDPSQWRADAYGHHMKYEDYGCPQSVFGWEFDHYPIPKSLGGPDDVSNLRPLNCGRNRSLGGILGGILAK